MIVSNILKTFSYTNIVSNGNFDNGTIGWSPLNSTLSQSNNTLYIQGDGTSSTVRARQVLTNPQSLSNKILFVRGIASVTNSVATSMSIIIATNIGNLSVKSISTPLNGSYYDMNGRVTVQSNITSATFIFAHIYSSSANANGKIAELQECLCIDLTSLFGAGNEPSAADCANIFRFVDGTKQPNFSKQIAL